MEIQNEITNNLNNIKENQNKFLNTTIGKIVNNAVDIGLRYILPDFIEEEVIEVKNSLIKNGLNAGINTAIDNAINIGKSAIGIVTGNFENISQIQKAIKTGGMIDTISDVLDFATDKATELGLINKNISSVVKSGKDAILNNVSSNIEKELSNQKNDLEKLQEYSENWKMYYANKDFNGMEKEYSKIEKHIKNLIPIEKTIKDIRTIEALHNLIKNNGQNFELSEQQIELVSKLS